MVQSANINECFSLVGYLGVIFRFYWDVFAKRTERIYRSVSSKSPSDRKSAANGFVLRGIGGGGRRGGGKADDRLRCLMLGSGCCG